MSIDEDIKLACETLKNGGNIIATGTPEKLATVESPTASYIKQELNI